MRMGSEYMKIEKINENQIKFILSKADLSAREINLDELSSPSAKTQDLFRDIMEQALEEYDFIADDAPLMVEAVPVAMDGIMIIVTKLSDGESPENKMTLITQSKDARRFKRKPIFNPDTSKKEGSFLCIYSFSCLDDIIALSHRIAHLQFGRNALYKYEGRYFLILQGGVYGNTSSLESLDMILAEYGRKHIATLLSKYFILEHGEPILEDSAIKTLAKNM